MKIRKLYTKQRNYCVSLLRKTKKASYENLDERKVSDNKLWKKSLEKTKAFTIRKIQCQRKDKVE